jgi:acyl-CoA thioesterase-1
MKKFFIALLFLLCVSSSVYANNTILIIGDSLSAGHGMDSQKSWPVLLQKKLAAENLAYQVVNASISGSTTSNGLAILPGNLEKYRPQITIIELGGNDGLRGLDIPVIKSNLQQMVLLAKKQGKVLLLGVRLPPNYGPVYNQQFGEIFTKVAKENKVGLVPFFLSGVDDNPALMQSDGIHPTAEAQAKMLGNVWGALEKFLSCHLGRKPGSSGQGGQAFCVQVS